MATCDLIFTFVFAFVMFVLPFAIMFMLWL